MRTVLQTQDIAILSHYIKQKHDLLSTMHIPALPTVDGGCIVCDAIIYHHNAYSSLDHYNVVSTQPVTTAFCNDTVET